MWKYASSFAALNGLCMVRQVGLPVCKGRVFKQNVSVLGDTGWSSVVVKRL